MYMYYITNGKSKFSINISNVSYDDKDGYTSVEDMQKEIYTMIDDIKKTMIKTGYWFINNWINTKETNMLDNICIDNDT